MGKKDKIYENTFLILNQDDYMLTVGFNSNSSLTVVFFYECSN